MRNSYVQGAILGIYNTLNSKDKIRIPNCTIKKELHNTRNKIQTKTNHTTKSYAPE